MFFLVFAPLFLAMLGFSAAIALPGTTFVLSLFGLLCLKAWSFERPKGAPTMAPLVLVTCAISLVSFLLFIVQLAV